jgi:predicted ATPase/DNA-binding winged helix-turn-helix (wHTH) protein
MEPEPHKGVDRDPGEFAAFGPFLLFPGARQLQRDGKPVEIGGRALEVLIELVTQAGRVVSKAELVSAIWEDTTVVEGVLRTHVCNLRKALGDGVAGARYVTSVAGRGYCFVAPVVRSVAEATTPASPSAWKVPHGLPPRLARMAGRDEVVRTLTAQILEHRFVTLVGAAGIGKTTVAVAVAHALLDHFGGAVRFIELGPLADPALVGTTVASTLGVPMQTDDPVESLRAFLHDKRLLLVLDNCEHVVEAAANLAEHLFLRAPGVHLLTTTRESLRVEGEHAHHLGPLETPMEHLGLNAETVQTFPAVHVFLERAAASGWSGDLADEDVPIVAETCRRLDGVALALELAASFVGQHGLRGLPGVLDDRLRLLCQHGCRTAPPRQQTLDALIAWSYERLREPERVILRRLSVFVGAFSIHAAKAVALEGGDFDECLVEVMDELVAKSLLSDSVADRMVVYRLLETTRVYALERLAESGEFERVSQSHAAFFTEHLALGSEGMASEPAGRQRAMLGDLRVALQRCFSSPLGSVAGVRLAAAAAKMLLELGLVSECQTWCRRALDVIEAPDAGTFVEVDLLEAFAIAAMFSKGNADHLRSALSRGVALARALGGGDHEVRLLGHLNSFLIRRGEFKEALEVAERCATPARAAEIGGQVRARWMLAFSHHLSGDQAAAAEHCEAALRLEPTSGELPPVVSGRSRGLFIHPHLGIVARILWLRGHPDRALATARNVVHAVAALKQPFARSSAMILCEAVFVWCGEWAGAEGLINMLADLVDRYSLGSQRGAVTALRGEFLVRTGRPQEGCALLRTAASMQKAEQNASQASMYAGALAEGLAATGALAEALGTVESAITEAEQRGGTLNLPELQRIKGVLLALRSPTDERAVDEALYAALETARRQGAIAWELRATTALARERLRRGGGRNELRDLAALYARFSEGMGTPDLQEARSLLDGHRAESA